MNNKTIIITGSNSGIGLRAAVGLAQQGHTVVLMCRNRQRGEGAREQIRTQTGSNNVDLILVDMASQHSVRNAAAEFLSHHTRLDVIINNAANFDISLKNVERTVDSMETIFATNHLGPFLLTNLLLGALQSSAPARIINVASKGLITYPNLNIEFDNLQGEKKYSPTHAYYHSKLAQIIFTLELAKRLEGTGVTANCIRVPAVRLDEGRYENVPAFLQALYRLKMRFSLSPEQMAQAYIRLATDPEFEDVTGTYVDENCKPVGIPRHARNVETWQRLWDVSAELTHLPASIAV